MKKILALFLVLYLLTAQNTSVYAHEIEMPEEMYIEEAPTPIPPPQYSAAAAVVMDASTGLVLYGYEANTPMYPASITKVMTALLVIEHTSDFNERIEFSDNAIWSIPRRSSHIYMDVGETLSIYEALHAMMLPSANEVSIALAEHVAGSVEAFADLMNRRAAALGAHNTHFVNPSGLHANGHITTAYDMALIMREAVRHQLFRDIISTVRFDIPPTERQPEVRELLNTNRMIRQDPHFNERVVGGKTGFTPNSGNTLVTYARDIVDEYHEGTPRRLIVTVLRGEGAGAFTDTTALLNYGFALPLEPTTVFDAETYIVAVPVYQEINGNQVEIGRVNISAENSLTFDLPPDFDTSQLRYELSIPETLEPPVLLNDNVGSVAVYVQNIRVGSLPLRAQDAVFAYTPPSESEAYDNPAYEYTNPYLAAIYSYVYNSRQSFLDNEYVITLAIPIAISILTLVIALIVYLTRRKRRMRRALHARYARYPDFYRYR